MSWVWGLRLQVIIELAKATAMTVENGSQRDCFSVAKFDSLCKKSKIVWDNSCTRKEACHIRQSTNHRPKVRENCPREGLLQGFPWAPGPCPPSGPVKCEQNLFFFWPCSAACGILVPWPGIEPVPFALQEQSLNHWTSREVLDWSDGIGSERKRLRESFYLSCVQVIQ